MIEPQSGGETDLCRSNPYPFRQDHPRFISYLLRQCRTVGIEKWKIERIEGLGHRKECSSELSDAHEADFTSLLFL